MAHRDARGGCLGCVTVVFLAVAITVVAILRFAPPFASNVLRAYGRRAQDAAERIKDRIEGTEHALDVDTSSLGFAGTFLTESQKRAYAQLYQGLLSLEETFAVFETTADDMDPAYKALMRDHPEIFWADGSLAYTYSALGKVVTVTPGYTMSASEVAPMRMRIEAEADGLLASLGTDATEYDIARAAYTYIISTTDYDIAAPDSQNIVSVFVNHVSVCAGYARAYQYLLQRAGIFCAYVEGTVADGAEDHAWNLVNIDGEFAYVDTCWGDPTYLGSSPNIDPAGVIYDYLCLTTEEITRDGHVFEDSSIWPVCASTSLDYYRRHGLFFDAYEEAALAASFLAQTADGARTCAFKFATDEAVAQTRAAIEAGTFLNSELSPRTSSYSYTVSDTLRIIKLYW